MLYESPFWPFAEPDLKRSAPECRRLYVDLMEDRPSAVKRFRDFMRTQGIAVTLDEPAERLTEEWVAANAEGEYGPQDGGHGFVAFRQLKSAWASYAVDWGIFLGEASRRKYPTLYWAYFNGSPRELGRCLPIMYGVPGVPRYMEITPVTLAITRVKTAARSPQTMLLNAASWRDRWGTGDPVQIARQSMSNTLRDLDPGRVHEVLTQHSIPALPPPGKTFLAPGARKVAAGSQDPIGTYRSLQNDLTGQSSDLLVVEAGSRADALQAIDEWNSSRQQDSISRRIVDLIEDVVKTWPEVEGDDWIESPYERSPGDYDGGPVHVFALSAFAPNMLERYICTRAETLGLYVYLPGTGQFLT